MADEYTPSTGQVRIAFAYVEEASDALARSREEAFDRWLREVRAKAVTDFAALTLPTDLYRKAQEHANTIREGGKG